NSEGKCVETGNLWDHFKMSAVATIDTCANEVEINSSRPELAQLHTGRTLTWFAINQGFRSVKAMLKEVNELLVSEEQGKTYVEKKPADAALGEAPVHDESHPLDPS
ncbi:hypothetical protein AAVH_31328, partial [Aphelenchoides avenae]